MEICVGKIAVDLVASLGSFLYLEISSLFCVCVCVCLCVHYKRGIYTVRDKNVEKNILKMHHRRPPFGLTDFRPIC